MGLLFIVITEAMSEIAKFKKEIRIAISDYMRAEGCSCCRNIDDHAEAKKRIARLLRVRKYPDGSGYDFTKYQTKKP